MTVLHPDPIDNDIQLERNGTVVDFKLAQGKEAYGVILKSVISTLQGELQLDTERGIPYEDTIWSSIRNLERWKLLVRSTVEEYDFVDSVTSLDTTIKGKRLDYTLTVLTGEGEVVVSGSI